MRKNFIAITLMLSGISVISLAQTVQLKGDISSLKAEEAVISYKDKGKEISDTVVASNGHFFWLAAMPEPQKIMMKVSNRYYLFFVEAGSLSLSTHSNSAGLTIKGSPVNDAYHLLDSTLRPIREQEFMLQRQLKAATGTAQVQLMQQMAELNRKQRSVEDAYILSNPSSPVSVNLVFEQSRTGTYERINALFLQLDSNARKSMMGKEIRKSLEILKRSAIDQPMANFLQSDTSGRPVRISEVKGKYVLIDFWASWCMPCRAENPRLLDVYSQFKEKGFTVLGISLDKDKASWKKAILDDQLPWQQFSDLKGWKNEIAQYYGVFSIPGNLLVDQRGRIVSKNLSVEALRNKLTELLD